MPPPDLVIRGHHVVTENGIVPASIHISLGRIAAVAPFADVPPGSELIEARDDSVIMPGLVDTHVHVNGPGRTEWGGFETATRAAAAGGVTTIVDMPLNSIPPTTSVKALQAKLEAAHGKLTVDVGFWGGAVPGNAGELAGLWDAGVVGFKCFLVHSGVDEFPQVSESDLREVMPEVARLGAVLIVHAELAGPIEEAWAHSIETSPKEAGSYYTFLRSRPAQAETEAIAMMIRLSREFGTRVHIVHLSAAGAIPQLTAARAAGVRITSETCPHYLHFAAEAISDGETQFKCCPPIRERENREELWQGLLEGNIEMIVSDHSPCPASMKLLETGNFLRAWGGISSLQFSLSAVWNEAVRREASIIDLARWMCSAPAQLAGLQQRKGEIAAGLDADLVIWSPKREFTVRPDEVHHRHKLTPYAGESLPGKVEKTFLRGQIVYDDGEFTSDPSGEILLREK